MTIRPTLSAALSGTSLTTGRLSADWAARLQQWASTFPECVGPIAIWNMGRGGWTSTDLLANAPNIVALRPQYVLTESGSINDCAETAGVPAVSLAQHETNLEDYIDVLQNGIPGVDITVQTMSPVSTTNTIRPLLSDYYANDLATAAAKGVESINNFAGWPNPLPLDLTYDEDGLHPIWDEAVELYLFPNVSAWLRSKMTEFWA